MSSITKSAESEFRTFPRPAASPPRPCSKRRFARPTSQAQALFRRPEPATELARPPSTKIHAPLSSALLRFSGPRTPPRDFCTHSRPRGHNLVNERRSSPSNQRERVDSIAPYAFLRRIGNWRTAVILDCAFYTPPNHRGLNTESEGRLPRASSKRKSRSSRVRSPPLVALRHPCHLRERSKVGVPLETIPQIKIAFRQSPAKSSALQTIKVPSVTSESVDKQGYRPFERPRLPPNQPSFTPPHTKKSRSTCSRMGSTFITPNPASL